MTFRREFNFMYFLLLSTPLVNTLINASPKSIFRGIFVILGNAFSFPYLHSDSSLHKNFNRIGRPIEWCFIPYWYWYLQLPDHFWNNKKHKYLLIENFHIIIGIHFFPVDMKLNALKNNQEKLISSLKME